MNKLKAVIFDWDGVVLDSSIFHEKSWDILAKRHNLDLPEGHFKKGFGKRNEEIIPTILAWVSPNDPRLQELAFEKEEIYRELLSENALMISPLPGVIQLLEDCKNHSICVGVGSSTPKQNLLAGLQVLELEDVFQVLVSGDDVVNGKPDPEVFLKVASQLGIDPNACVVLEDSHSGLEAASNAGMKRVGVATTHPLESLQADLLVTTLQELNLDVLNQLFEESAKQCGFSV